MRRDEFKINMKVKFGRPNGEKTEGIIKKINSTTCKIEITEERGNSRGSEVGTVWKVPFYLIHPFYDNNQEPLTASCQSSRITLVKIEYSFLQPMEDQFVMLAISTIYTHLSPENLCADGERSKAEVQRRAAMLKRKLLGLFSVLGQEVTEEQAYGVEKGYHKFAKGNR